MESIHRNLFGLGPGWRPPAGDSAKAHGANSRAFFGSRQVLLRQSLDVWLQQPGSMGQALCGSSEVFCLRSVLRMESSATAEIARAAGI